MKLVWSKVASDWWQGRMGPFHADVTYGRGVYLVTVACDLDDWYWECNRGEPSAELAEAKRWCQRRVDELVEAVRTLDTQRGTG